MAEGKHERLKELGLGALFLVFGLLILTYAVLSWTQDNPVMSKPMAIGAALLGLLLFVIGGAAFGRAIRGK
jgi:hypothetical protein